MMPPARSEEQAHRLLSARGELSSNTHAFQPDLTNGLTRVDFPESCQASAPRAVLFNGYNVIAAFI